MTRMLEVVGPSIVVVDDDDEGVEFDNDGVQFDVEFDSYVGYYLTVSNGEGMN